MDTLGTTPKRIVRKEETHSINESFVAKVAMDKGTIVKFDTSNGQVEPVTAVDDTPIGILSVGAKINEECTIHSQFVGIFKGKAGASAITIGDNLAAASFDATAKLQVYQAAASGNFITAVALETVAASGEFWVGVLRTFYPAA